MRTWPIQAAACLLIAAAVVSPCLAQPAPAEPAPNPKQFPAIVMIEASLDGAPMTWPRTGYFLPPDRIVTARHTLISSTRAGFINFGAGGSAEIESVLDLGEDLDIAVLRIVPPAAGLAVPQEPPVAPNRLVACDRVSTATREETGRIIRGGVGPVLTMYRENGITMIDSEAGSRPGFSGGVLLNADQQVVGIVTGGDGDRSMAASIHDILDRAGEGAIYKPIEPWLKDSVRPHFSESTRLRHEATNAQQAGRLDDAAAALRRAIGVEPVCWEARSALVDILFQQGDEDGVSAELAEWLESGVRLDQRTLVGGACAVQSGRHHEGLALLRESLAQRESVSALVWLSYALDELGRSEDAAEALDRADALEPGDPRVLRQRMQHLTQHGRAIEAVELIDVLRRADCAGEALAIAVTTLATAGRIEDAVALATEGLENFPDDGTLLTAYAYTLVSADRCEEAKDIARRAAEASPNDPVPLIYLAGCYYRMQEWTKAAETYEAALRISPDQADTVSYLVYAHIMAGNRAEAKRWLKRLEQLDPYAAQRAQYYLDAADIDAEPDW